MYIFAVVRDATELEHTNRMLSTVLSRQMRHQPGAFLGLWVDPGMVDDVPPVIDAPGTGQQLLIRETSGLAGLWTICWCTAANSRAAVSRAMLVQALALASTTGDGAFAPVFAANATSDSVRAEMEALSSIHSVAIISPFYQDRFTGQLFPLRSRVAIG